MKTERIIYQIDLSEDARNQLILKALNQPVAERLTKSFQRSLIKYRGKAFKKFGDNLPHLPYPSDHRTYVALAQDIQAANFLLYIEASKDKVDPSILTSAWAQQAARVALAQLGITHRSAVRSVTLSQGLSAF